MHDPLDPSEVVYPGQLDQDFIPSRSATILDHRLRYAQFINAVPDRLHRLGDGLVPVNVFRKRIQLHDICIREPSRGRNEIPLEKLVVQNVAKLPISGLIDPFEPESAVFEPRVCPEHDVLVIEKLPQTFNCQIGLRTDGIVGHNLQDQVRTTFQVQTQANPFLHFGQRGWKAGKQKNSRQHHNENDQTTIANSLRHISTLVPAPAWTLQRCEKCRP